MDNSEEKSVTACSAYQNPSKDPREQKIISVGIDIGTTTTQLVISRLTVRNVAPGNLVPQMEITEKEVLYRSDIHVTPLLEHDIIDAKSIADIVSLEYATAGITPADIETGAVIITGETAKKENAKHIVESMTGLAGEFVVATAGVNLESILAGRGSGAAGYSRVEQKVVCNIDVGGGTANYAVFDEGRTVDVACINIGGHLIELAKDSDTITYIADPVRSVLREAGLDLMVGQKITIEQLKTISKIMAKSLVDVTVSNSLTGVTDELMMTPPMKLNYKIDEVVISGGVADFVYSDYRPISVASVAQFADIGPALGWAIREAFAEAGIKLEEPMETIRATVIGAGTHSMNLSGSTISASDATLPLRNVTVVTPFVGDVPDSQKEIAETVQSAVARLIEDSDDHILAVAMDGPEKVTFESVQTMARGIADGMREYLKGQKPLIILLKKDCAKVLGQSLKIIFGKSIEIICIDQVNVNEGDYIDIGNPIMGDRVVPIVIKTLVFESAPEKNKFNYGES